MSKQIAETVGDKRIALLLAILAAFAVFATLATQASNASAASLTAPADSQAISPSTNDLSTPNANLPDIRGSTTSAVTDVANVFFGITDSVASTNGAAAAQSPPMEFWAFVAVTVAFAVLLRVATLGPLVENASPRYIRRQEMRQRGNRYTRGASPGFAGASFFNTVSYVDDTGISKRFGLKRASHATVIATQTSPTRNFVTATIWNIANALAHLTATVLGHARGAVHSSAHFTWKTAVGAISVISYYARTTHGASIRISSSAHRTGAGFAYPIIAPIVAGTIFTVRRNNAAATPGESELLHHTNTEHGRNIARGSPSSSMHQLWQPKPAAFALQI